MSGGAVTPIREGRCVRRKNRKEDDETIRLRCMIATAEAAAFADSRADTMDDRVTALTLSWAMERKLPRNRLRFIGGTLDQRQDFALRVIEVEIASAEREAFSGKIARTRILHGTEAAKDMFPENDRIFARYQQAMLDMVNTPAPTRRDLDRKRKTIGGIWLHAEGAWYDQLRAAVAADEERLAANRKA